MSNTPRIPRGGPGAGGWRERAALPPTPPPRASGRAPTWRRMGPRLTAHLSSDGFPSRSAGLRTQTAHLGRPFSFKGASAFWRAEDVSSSPVFQVTPPLRALPAEPDGAPRRRSLHFCRAKPGVKHQPGGRCLSPAEPVRLRAVTAEERAPLSASWGQRAVGVRSALGTTLQPGGVPGSVRAWAAFAAQHCPLVSGVETAPLGCGSSLSSALGANLCSLPGLQPRQSCPGGLRKALTPRSEPCSPPSSSTHLSKEPLGAVCAGRAISVASAPC